jgi:hypothetical protein
LSISRYRSKRPSGSKIRAGVQDANPIPGLEGIPLFRSLHFEDIRVQDVLVDAAAIHPEKMLDGLVLEKISGTGAQAISIANARNVVLKNISVTGDKEPLVKIVNVKGKGFEGAVEAIRGVTARLTDRSSGAMGRGIRDA